MSGNPAGTSKGASIAAALRRAVTARETARLDGEPLEELDETVPLVRRKADQIADALIRKALDAHGADALDAIKLLLDRVDGPVKQAHEHSTGPGGLTFVPLSPMPPAMQPLGPGVPRGEFEPDGEPR